jgi:large subunit ribosomal protein L10
MSKTKNQKQSLIDQYKESLSKFDAFFILEPQSLNPVEATALKKDLAPLNSQYNLVKNSLFEKALEQSNMPVVSLGKGQHSIVFSMEKISETAKMITKHSKAKDKERLVIMGGVLNSKLINSAQVVALSELPSKEVLLSQLLNVMNAPIRNFLYVLKGNMQEFTYLLRAIEEKKTSVA